MQSLRFLITDAAKTGGSRIAAGGLRVLAVAAFPGLFAGALRVRAARFCDPMLLVAARAIAASAPAGQLLPDPLSGTVHEEVAAGVAAAADAGG